MDKKLTIEDVKKKKIQLEKDILKTIQDFEKECGVKISYISLNRSSESTEAVPEPRREGPIKNVNASMELDLIY